MVHPGARMSVRSLVTAILLAASALAGAYLLLIHLSQLFTVTFLAILFAVALDVPTSLFQRRFRVPRSVSLILVSLMLVGFLTALGATLGPQVAEQIDELQKQVLLGVDNARKWLTTTEPFRSLLRFVPTPKEVTPPAGELLRRTQRALLSGFGVVVDLLIVVFVGYFLAANPKRYAEGFLLLVPEPRRNETRNVLLAMARALRWWLVARVFLMSLVGMAFGICLWILDVPLKLPLAVLAGLLDFIPYVGPMLGYIPALAVSLLQGPKTALYVTAFYVVIQFVESYLAEPLIEAKTVTIPPALLVLAQILSVLWLGVIGILLATPLVIITVVAVQMLYVKRFLGEDIQVAGQR